MASARGAPEGSPRRGQPGWRDSDTAEESVHVHALPSGGVAVHCATVAGTRGGGSGRPNQDCFAACDGLLAPTHSIVYAALFDGHGPYGHFVARHVRDRLPAWVASCSADGHAASPKPGTPAWVLRAGTVWVVDADLSLSKQSPPSLPASAPPWCASVARAFVELDGDLCSARSQLLAASKVSCEQSGCTAVAAILGDGHLLVASCGDSAAFLAVEAVPGSPLGAADVASVPRPRYGVARLTVAHKPAGEEAQRLRLAGGRVAAHPGEEHSAFGGGNSKSSHSHLTFGTSHPTSIPLPPPPTKVPRVWPNPSNGSAGCGLAVARAFGDLAWKGAGVCAMPDVALRTLSPSDAFLLLCSDGVTDALSGAAAVATAADALHGGGGAANAAAAVNAAAKAAWATRFPRHARDDITCVVALLRPLSTPPTKP